MAAEAAGPLRLQGHIMGWIREPEKLEKEGRPTRLINTT